MRSASRSLRWLSARAWAAGLRLDAGPKHDDEAVRQIVRQLFVRTSDFLGAERVDRFGIHGHDARTCRSSAAQGGEGNGGLETLLHDHGLAPRIERGALWGYCTPRHSTFPCGSAIPRWGRVRRGSSFHVNVQAFSRVPRFGVAVRDSRPNQFFTSRSSANPTHAIRYPPTPTAVSQTWFNHASNVRGNGKHLLAGTDNTEHPWTRFKLGFPGHWLERAVSDKLMRPSGMKPQTANVRDFPEHQSLTNVVGNSLKDTPE